jgi:hypothetical protein
MNEKNTDLIHDNINWDVVNLWIHEFVLYTDSMSSAVILSDIVVKHIAYMNNEHKMYYHHWYDEYKFKCKSYITFLVHQPKNTQQHKAQVYK